MNIEEVIKLLEDLKLEHYTCEDCFYSCPLSEDDFCGMGGECNCGADEHNAKVNALIELVCGGVK